jgi:hypothetical protein
MRELAYWWHYLRDNPEVPLYGALALAGAWACNALLSYWLTGTAFPWR